MASVVGKHLNVGTPTAQSVLRTINHVNERGVSKRTAKLETLDSAIVAEYPTFGVPADQIVSDPSVAEAFWIAVQLRLPATGDVDVVTKNKRLLNLRRRGEDKGGLPRLERGYNGRGPNKPKPR